MNRNALKSVKEAISHVDIDDVTEKARHGLDRLTHLSQNVGDDEKRLSLIGGAALAAIGLARINKVSGWLALGAATALIVRGSTGHCELYSALGVDTKHK